MTQAFANVRILDFSQVIAGPYAAQLLNMLGATVIKVEQPDSGDQMRGLLTLPDPPPGDMSPPFIAYNFGKQSIAINLRTLPIITAIHRCEVSALSCSSSQDEKHRLQC